MLLFLLTLSLASVPWPAIFLVIALVMLAFAAFIGPPAPAPFYRRFNWGWAGMFFFVLALAVG
jgi:hypothetical protein